MSSTWSTSVCGVHGVRGVCRVRRPHIHLDCFSWIKVSGAHILSQAFFTRVVFSAMSKYSSPGVFSSHYLPVYLPVCLPVAFISYRLVPDI